MAGDDPIATHEKVGEGSGEREKVLVRARREVGHRAGQAHDRAVNDGRRPKLADASGQIFLNFGDNLAVVEGEELVGVVEIGLNNLARLVAEFIVQRIQVEECPAGGGVEAKAGVGGQRDGYLAVEPQASRQHVHRPQVGQVCKLLARAQHRRACHDPLHRAHSHGKHDGVHVVYVVTAVADNVRHRTVAVHQHIRQPLIRQKLAARGLDSVDEWRKNEVADGPATPHDIKIGLVREDEVIEHADGSRRTALLRRCK
mmetsp:Transcript_5086/g.8744  ORF Transcript_5086/g.8744 Transcript_5086/m.8744 type:complete len:257 (-) Transcript_5086:860-1630(-)